MFHHNINFTCFIIMKQLFSTRARILTRLLGCGVRHLTPGQVASSRDKQLQASVRCIEVIHRHWTRAYFWLL